MPLSKARMRERKKQDRPRFRFDIRSNTGIVKPKPMVRYGIEESTGKHIELDADGNLIPDM